MALDIENVPEFVGRVTPADANYPLGSSQDESAPGNDDGTPYIKKRANDLFGLMQSLLASASISPNGAPDTALVGQYLKAINEQASGRAQTFDDVGAANAYVLNVRANQQTPEKVFDGQELWFNPVNSQTTAVCTLNPYGQGVLSIKKPGGVANLDLGSIVAGVKAKLTYRTAPAPHYELAQVWTSTNTIVAANYIIFPNGFKVMWGSNIASFSGWIIPYPIAFDVIGHVVGSWNAVIDTDIPTTPPSFMNGDENFFFSVKNGGGGLNGIDWLAVGF